MGWIKLDHILLTHPKVWAAPEAFGLYCASLLYADVQDSDGFIPDHAIGHLLPGLPKLERLWDRLVQVGLWVEVEGGIEIYNYLKHNRSSDDKQAIRQKRQAAGAIGGSKPRANPQANAKQVGSEVESNAADSVQPEKKRIEESREEKTLKASSQATPDDLPRFEEFWAQYPRQANGTKPEPKLAKDQWSRLKAPERLKALSALPYYRRHLEQNPDISPKHAFRWLRDRSFEGYNAPPLELVNGRPSPLDDTEEQARRLVARAQ